MFEKKNELKRDRERLEKKVRREKKKRERRRNIIQR